MNLKKWFDKSGVKKRFFAKEVGVSYTTLFNWINGNTYPHKKQFEKIEKITNNEVTEEDFLKDAQVQSEEDNG